jgi:uncharacterized protein YcaQ
MELPRALARRLALHGQGLDGSWELVDGAMGAATVVERLGHVQIDTIAVVERAHHHVLWSRQPSYRPEALAAAMTVERRVFEHWAHAAAYLPMAHYRYFLPKMHAAARRESTRRWLAENADVVDEVRRRIRAEGPLGSADFAAPEGFRRGTWWSWKPAKRALETLFATGELMVSARKGFNRLYDLTERVMPPHVDTTEPSRVELGQFAVRRALSTMGVATSKEIAWGLTDVPTVEAALTEMVATGQVVTATLTGVKDGPHYALAEALDGLGTLPAVEPRLRILSPFDNLVIRRRWLKNVFGFDFALECYLPASKRVYGYYCLPLLWADTFVGRLDAKADRKAGVLIARSVWLEPDGPIGDGLLAALAQELHAFAAFNECERIAIERVMPGSAAVGLRRAVERGPVS